MNDLAKKIEAFLFISSDEADIKKIAKITGVSEDQVMAAFDELKIGLEGHGLKLVKTTTHVKLTTSPEVGEFIAQFAEKEVKSISKAAAETLALIAYRGPIATHDINVIRGVDSRRIMAQLLRRGLIKKAVSDTDVTLYEITTEFLQHLGISQKEELPEFDKLSDNESIRRVLEEKI